MAPGQSDHKHRIGARVREFSMPPVHDALVLGKDAAIGCAAMRRAIELIVPNSFAHIEFEDDVISDILVRESILRRIPQEKLIRFIVANIKPMMTAEEILHLDLDVEVAVGGDVE